MQATRILPDLQSSLLCEEVRQEANGNLFLIGVMNIIRVPQLPVVAARLCVFNRWTAGHRPVHRERPVHRARPDDGVAQGRNEI